MFVVHVHIGRGVTGLIIEGGGGGGGSVDTFEIDCF